MQEAKQLNKFEKKIKTYELNEFVKKYKAYIENITLFIILLLLTTINNKIALFSIADLNLIYIILMGVRYGTNQSIISAVLSCLLLIGNSLFQGKSLVSIILLTESVVQVLTYILAGVSVGYYSDYKNNKIKEQESHITEQQEKYKFLKELYDNTYNEKNILENQVITSKDSFGKIYGVIKKIESLETQYILKSAIDVLEEFLENETIAIYTLNKGYMRLNAKSKNRLFNIKKSMKIDDLKEAKDVLLNGEIYINKSFDKDIPSMIAPIINKNNVIALIVVRELEFCKMSLYHQNLFKVMVNLIESSMIRAIAYEEAISSDRYIDNTIFLNSEEFEKIIAINEEAKNNNKVEYTLLHVEETNTLQNISSKLEKCIRETDFAGINKYGEIYILLSNTSKEEGQVVVDRMLKNNIKVEFVDETMYGVESYA